MKNVNVVPKLSEEEIEDIINTKYSDKDEKTKTFIRKALIKHGNTYDYSKTEYIRNNSKVIIHCSKHDYDFSQTPGSHLLGCGCPKCANEKKGSYHKSSTKEFIAAAMALYPNNEYGYEKVNYVNNYTKVIIIDHLHNDEEFFSHSVVFSKWSSE